MLKSQLKSKTKLKISFQTKKDTKTIPAVMDINWTMTYWQKNEKENDKNESTVYSVTCVALTRTVILRETYPWCNQFYPFVEKLVMKISIFQTKEEGWWCTCLLSRSLPLSIRRPVHVRWLIHLLVEPFRDKISEMTKICSQSAQNSPLPSPPAAPSVIQVCRSEKLRWRKKAAVEEDKVIGRGRRRTSRFIRPGCLRAFLESIGAPYINQLS